MRRFILTPVPYAGHLLSPSGSTTRPLDRCRRTLSPPSSLQGCQTPQIHPRYFSICCQIEPLLQSWQSTRTRNSPLSCPICVRTISPPRILPDRHANYIPRVPWVDGIENQAQRRSRTSQDSTIAPWRTHHRSGIDNVRIPLDCTSRKFGSTGPYSAGDKQDDPDRSPTSRLPDDKAGPPRPPRLIRILLSCFGDPIALWNTPQPPFWERIPLRRGSNFQLSGS